MCLYKQLTDVHAEFSPVIIALFMPDSVKPPRVDMWPSGFDAIETTQLDVQAQRAPVVCAEALHQLVQAVTTERQEC